MSRMTGFLAAVLLVLALAPAASAGPSGAVDPSTLTPPPNPNFEWDCRSNGQRIDCRGVETSTAVDENPNPDFSCGDRLILATLTQVRTAHRVHDAQGRVIRQHLVGTFDETWRLEGTTAPELTARGRWNITITYAVPGDVTSRTISSAGNDLWVTAPGSGLIFHNAGVVRFNWDESEILAIHGPHDMFEDFGGAIAAACEAFGA